MEGPRIVKQISMVSIVLHILTKTIHLKVFKFNLHSEFQYSIERKVRKREKEIININK